MYKLQKSAQTIFVEITPVLDTKWNFGLAGQLQKKNLFDLKIEYFLSYFKLKFEFKFKFGF